MTTSNPLAQRQAGILMPIFSIPSKSGIGELGDETRRFIDDSAEAGFKIWQILPLNPVAYGNSPYQPYSSFAGDPLFISLEELKKDGLLDEYEVLDQANPDRVDYELVRKYKDPWLRKAFENFKTNPDPLYNEFLQNAFWLDRYALFQVFKDKNNGLPWTSWPVEQQNAVKAEKEDEQEVEYQKFLQFIFWKQWKAILDYAHEKGLIVVGDLPIYVGHDSADVWQFRDAFLLDEKGMPTVVAGCPPDYFSEDGQLWGNPIYDWDGMKKDDYDFWQKRFAWNKDLFDVMRIDHFIGFDRYWSIPAGSETAKTGHYETGPSYDFFDVIYDKLPDLQLIAEDLGVLRPEVTQLKDKYGLLGMKIGQYSFGENEQKIGFVLPEGCIVYPGTHDNDPVNGWYKNLSRKDRKNINRIFKELKLKGKSPADKVVNYSLNSDARIAVLPMQDILDLDSRAKINSPGTIGSPNWEWRMPDFALYEAKLPLIRKELKKSNRLVRN